MVVSDCFPADHYAQQASSSGGHLKPPGHMNAAEFSQFLQCLLDDVHNHAVEEYCKAISVGDRSAAAPDTTPESNTLPSCQLTSVRSLGPLPENQGCGRERPPKQLEHSDTDLSCLGPAGSVFDESEDLYGRCWTVPGLAETQEPPCPSTHHRSSMLLGHDAGGCVINPDLQIMKNWALANIVALGCVAVLTPFQVALLEPEFDVMFVVNCIIDFVFIVDMFLQFFLGYHVQTEYGSRLESRHSTIVCNYLRTWFLIDFVSVLPFDVLVMMMPSDDLSLIKGVKILRLIRLIKLVRIAKFPKLFKRLGISMHVTNLYQVLDLNKFILCLLLISHWLACLWAMTLALVDDDSARWVDTFEDSEMGVAEKTKDSVWKLYFASLYFTAYTMTSVGYGDVTPANILERIVCIGILFISGLLWACMIGRVSSIVGNLDAHEQEFKNLMDSLNRMMKDRKLPKPVRRRLRTFFLSTKKAQTAKQQEWILNRLSPVLRGEVALMSNWCWVNRVSFISALVPGARSADVTRAPHWVLDIALALGSKIFAQSEIFGEPRVMYILRQGLVVSRAHLLRKVYCKGSVWGEDFLLSRRFLREPEACLAMTYAEVFQLTFADFAGVCQRHRWNISLHIQLRKFIARLSARRAILVEARRRRVANAAQVAEKSHSRGFFSVVNEHTSATLVSL